MMMPLPQQRTEACRGAGAGDAGPPSAILRYAPRRGPVAGDQACGASLLARWDEDQGQQLLPARRDARRCGGAGLAERSPAVQTALSKGSIGPARQELIAAGLILPLTGRPQARWQRSDRHNRIFTAITRSPEQQ